MTSHDVAPVSIIPALRVRSIPDALPFWGALGFHWAFAFAEGDEVRQPPDPIDETAHFARLDAAGSNPISVFLNTRDVRPGSELHVMVATPAEVDEVAASLAALRIPLEQEPVDQPWGMRELSTRDVDDNRVVVGAAISWEHGGAG